MPPYRDQQPSVRKACGLDTPRLNILQAKSPVARGYSTTGSGQIVDHWMLLDNAPMMQQLGLAPALAPLWISFTDRLPKAEDSNAIFHACVDPCLVTGNLAKLEGPPQTKWGYLISAETRKIAVVMDNEQLFLQEKFYDWFGDPVSADPPLPSKADQSLWGSIRRAFIAFNSIVLRANIKFLSIGLVIGVGSTGLFLTGRSISPVAAANLPALTATATPGAYTATPAPLSTSTPVPPTSSYTPTPTLTRPTSTATVTPTLSDTLLWLLQDGTLSQAGPLELSEQLRVYEASLKYVSISTEKSQLLGEQINGPGYGSPSNICAPLSISILQEAGILSPDFNPHDFWLLNPDDAGDRKLLAEAFPPEKYGNYRTRVKLDQIDWNLTPLYPGDFVYLYAGKGGNFEHVLVVNRVDARGRAYAVTNHNTENGFVISEVLLYDPNQPGVGMFSVWTAWPRARLGSTGFAGFEVWRLRSQAP